jgi:hypothetical protein
MKNFKQYLKDDLNAVKKANATKLRNLAKANKDKEAAVRNADIEKKRAKDQADREKKIAAATAKSKKESIVQRVAEYIKSDGARKKCAGGDGRRTENHDCDKVHSDMSHKEWEVSQDTPKDEAK